MTENSYRDVNIAFANEMSIICDSYDLNVYKTKSIKKYSLKKNLDQINCIKGLKIPLFIGGGINQNNVSKIINSVRPDGLDISRSLKNSKNILSPKKLNSFLSQIYVA